MKVLLSLLLLLIIAQTNAQEPVQSLRGTIVDQVLQHPLAGATVSLPTLEKTVIADGNGYFRFDNVPIGHHRLTVHFTGYRVIVMEAVAVNAGKETVLQILMETEVRTESEVIIRSRSRRNLPLNEMSLVSARAFTVEETQKYAAAVNDPLRMAMAFPGVVSGHDGNNQIIIRGNTPTGLLWRMEGMDIPNPNHFGNAGSTGGGISILSSQLLSNSDFVTGAFAAEYGNALSGVFDLKLRKGNNEKHEYAVQAGVLGLNLAAEGPFSKNYKGSYLVNYRYSTLTLLNKIGVLPDEAATNFQDLSYHLYLPAGKAGSFTLFGFGGLSDDKTKPDADSLQWEEKADRYRSDFVSNTGYSALTHQIGLGRKAVLKTGISYSVVRNAYNEDLMDYEYDLQKNFQDKYTTRKINLNSSLQYRLNNQWQLRAGLMATKINFDYYQLSAENEGEPLEERINNKGNTYTSQLYVQSQYRVNERLTVNAGLHYLRLALNNTDAIDPRASLRWQIDAKNSIGFAYGLHSQMQSMGIYFAKEMNGTGEAQMPNQELEFTRAHHYVLSYGRKLGKSLMLKTEIYYQDLFNVPVGVEPGSTLSTLNLHDDFETEALANRGKGRNYGIEVSAERYLYNHFYFMLSQSFYQSKYTALDHKERDTRFNGNYIGTFVIGRDFESYRGSKTFGINLKSILAGGQRTTPIDEEESRTRGYTVFNDDAAFTLKNPAYFRTDLRISLKWNKRKHTSTLSLDIQNITNRLNVFNQWFDSDKGEIITNYQTGLIPILNWKLEF